MTTMRMTEQDLALEISLSVPVYIDVEQEENDGDDDDDDEDVESHPKISTECSEEFRDSGRPIEPDHIVRVVHHVHGNLVRCHCCSLMERSY